MLYVCLGLHTYARFFVKGEKAAPELVHTRSKQMPRALST